MFRGGWFDVKLTFSEDAVFFFNLLQRTQRLNTIPITGYKYYMVGVSSTSVKYHAHRELAVNSYTEMRFNLWRQVGISEEDIAKERRNALYTNTYFNVNNLFKKGSPLSFGDKLRNVKRLVFDNKDAREVIASADRSRRSVQLKVFDFCFDTKSPLLMTMTYELMYVFRNNFTWLFLKLRRYL